jgi:predicted nucleic acid-binding protein
MVSEAIKPQPDPGAQAWIEAQPPEDLAISSLALGEIQRGVIRLPVGRRRAALDRWLTHEVQVDYDGKTIGIDDAIALEWGRVSGEAMKRGRTLPDTDGLLVATAIVLNLTLVTRNERHCAGWGAPLINPWSGESRD